MPDPDRLQGVPIREASLPTASRDRWHRLFIMPASGRLSVICLSDRAVLVNTHYDNRPGIGKMHYCTGEGHCGFCRDGWVPFVYGYFAGQVVSDGGLYLLALPHASLANCKDAVKLLDKARGLVLHIERMKKSRRGPVVFSIDERRAAVSRIPAGWDVKADLMRRFGRLAFADRLSPANDSGYSEYKTDR